MATLNPTQNQSAASASNLAAPSNTRKLLQKNILWSLIGRVLPMGLALFTIPLILEGLGKERFGVLSVVWMVVGYANFFDFGLGRALTQLVSHKLGTQETEDLPSLIWTTLLMMGLFGLVACASLFIAAPWIVTPVLKVSPEYRQETILAMQFLACCLPFFFVTTALGGLLTSFQKFKAITILNIPLLIFNYFVPLMIFPFTHSLAAVVMGLVIGRIILLVANFIIVSKCVPGLTSNFSINKGYIPKLFSFGGWMTISNIISPIMESFDRLLIANMLTASVLAYYITPFDVVIKLLIIPNCIISVMFPALTTELAKDPAKAKIMYDKSILLVLATVLVPAVGIILGAKFGISHWINPEFATHAAPVAQVMAIGIIFNALAFIPFAFIQAKGHPDITAKFHLLELPIYVGCLWLFVTSFGLIGAAWAWTIRVALDSILLFAYAHKIRREL